MVALLDAARAVCCDEGDLFIAGGSEIMSRAPLVIAKAETAFARGQKVEDSTLGARFPNPKLITKYGNETMPQTADNIAADLNISRKESDLFAISSQKKYATAKSAGFFEEEILPVEVPGAKRKSSPIIVADDEHPGSDVSLDKLSNMKPLFDVWMLSKLMKPLRRKCLAVSSN